MTTMMFKAPPIAIDYRAMERNLSSWERFCQNWHRLDRVEITGEQCKALIEKVTDTTYFSSSKLLISASWESGVRSASALPRK